MDNQSHITALLGAGGSNPRADGLYASGTFARSVLSLEPGHSAYTLALSPDCTTAVVGTKLGLLYGIDFASAFPGGPSCLINQGAPVLSTCFVDKDTVAATDTLGRCLLWRMTPENQFPTVLLEGGSPLCGLVCVGRTLLSHHAEDGLIEWDLVRFTCIQVTGCPGPPEPFSSVRGLHWPAAGAVVFSGRGGCLLVYDLANRTVTSVKAHDSDFHAMALLGDGLATIGRSDGTMKEWRPDGLGLANSLHAPHHVVAAAVIDSYAQRLVLVNAKGSAQAVDVHQHKIESYEVLAGLDYRTVAGPAPEFLEESRRCRRFEEVEGIRKRLDKGLDTGHYGDPGSDLERLEELGCRPLVSAFGAQAAALAGDWIGELRSRLDLSATLPDTTVSLDSLRRHAELLECLGCHEAAAEVLRRMISIAHDNVDIREALERVSRQASLLVQGHGIMKPREDTPIPILIQAAEILGKPFRYRCLLKELTRLSLCDVAVSPTRFVTKYNSLCGENPAQSLPAPRMEELSLICGSEAPLPNPAITFLVDDGTEPGLQLSLSFFGDRSSTEVTPWVVFDAQSVAPDASPGEHNAACNRMLARLMSKAISPSRIRAVHKACLEVLGRVANELMAARAREIWS